MKIKKYIFLLFLFYSYIPLLAQVDTAWVRRYNGLGNGWDQAFALAVDDSGNVYVTGYSGSGTSADYATIKYAPDGNTQWVRRYNGPGNSIDWAFALAVDDSGNVCVTGNSAGNGTSGDYATIKYSPSGDTLWARRYNGTGNGFDGTVALALDDSGNVYVIGESFGSGTERDYATIKYSSSGDTLWVRRYNGPVDDDDEAFALAVDDSGKVYVTGYSFSGTSADYVTIKYTPNGDSLWVIRYNGPGNHNDIARALAVDGSGNLYVTGLSVGSGTDYDYATIKYSPAGDTLWVRRYNGAGNDFDGAVALALDNSGNIYVTGSSYGSGTSADYATIKYAPNGDTVWVRRYHGGDYDEARALAVDDSGNVYVTGSSGFFPNYDYTTIKYAPNGDTLWVKRYNGPANEIDNARALAVDNGGNVYVTGESDSDTGSFFPSQYDYATIKYVQFTCLAKPGDVTGDSKVLLPDIVAIINFLFKSAPAPNPLCRGDANGNGTVLLPDIVYLINFIFKSGPAPIKSRECCL